MNEISLLYMLLKIDLEYKRIYKEKKGIVKRLCTTNITTLGETPDETL